MSQPALTKAQQRRLEKLAREARRTPQAMLRFVLRDGFELCEEDVAAALSAEAEMARSGTVPHRQVSNEARAVLVSTKGQIVLPASVRKALGLKPRMRVYTRVQGKDARIAPASAKNTAKLSEIQAILKYSGPRGPVKDMRVTDYKD
jgi:bifunctional DNA-binding transcriptional regulator/antitoxin component of YhaV-PrlF toxin-antitoxin module